MQPAATTAKPKKTTSKWVKGALYTAFALAVAGHGYNDHLNTQIREAQDELIEAQGALIEAKQLEIDLLKQEGGTGGTCDDGFIIEDLKPRGPIQVKASKPARAVASRTI